MAGELSGFDVYWQIQDGASFVTLGAELSSTDNKSIALIDITNKADTEDRELLSGSGQITRDVTVELVSSSDAGLAAAVAAENTLVTIRQIRDSVAQTAFTAKLASVNLSSSNGDVERYSLTFNSTGAA